MQAQSSMRDIMTNSEKNLHTAFPAKVLSVKGDLAKVQPLFNFNGAAAAPLNSVPIPQSVRKYKVVEEKVTDTDDGYSHTYTTHYTKAIPPEAGDIVYCVVAEQTLGNSWKGMPTDRVGAMHHNLGDAVIVAIF